MKSIFAIAACIFVLGACWGAPPNEKILSQQCQTLFEGDESTLRRISNQAQSNLIQFCDCYAATAMTVPERIAIQKDVFIEMNVAKADAGTVEAAAEQVLRLIEDGDITSFTEDDLDSMSGFLSDVTEDMSIAGGNCTA